MKYFVELYRKYPEFDYDWDLKIHTGQETIVISRSTLNLCYYGSRFNLDKTHGISLSLKEDGAYNAFHFCLTFNGESNEIFSGIINKNQYDELNKIIYFLS